MTALQKRPVTGAQPLLYTRDEQGQKLDQLGAELKARKEQLDKLIQQYTDGLKDIPDNLKEDLEKRAVEFSKLSADIDQIKTDLVNQAKTRTQDEAHGIAAVLVRNTEAIEIAKTMLEKRQKGAHVKFDGIKARNLIKLENLGDNYQYAKNDLNRVPWQPLSVIDLINWAPISIDIVTLLRETSWNLMADVVPEGTIKPESDLEFGTQTLNIGTIAHWIKVSNQVLSDMPMLASYIETRLAYGIRYKLEYFVINGHIPASGQPKNFSGLMESGNHLTVPFVAGDTPLDVLSKAKYKAAASFIQPECFILNPEDWGNLERLKGNDGHYVIGAPTATGVQVYLWGLPVRFSPVQALSKYWCGNLSIGFDGYIREDVDTQISLEDGDNFRKNLATVLSEMRAAGGVIIPDANVAGTLPDFDDAPDAPVVVNNGTAELSGEAEEGSIIKVKNSTGDVIAVTLTDNTGAWNFTPSPVAEGESVTVTASSASGSESDAVSIVGGA